MGDERLLELVDALEGAVALVRGWRRNVDASLQLIDDLGRGRQGATETDYGDRKRESLEHRLAVFVQTSEPLGLWVTSSRRTMSLIGR